MRLGWDEKNRNAAELARGAENLGVALITVHGRTRCQFFKGKADWAAIRAVREAISIPLIANGDVADERDARDILDQSGADGVMVGRGAFGRPWAPGAIAQSLESGNPASSPSTAEQKAIVVGHYEAMLSHYPGDHGIRIARKHLGWYVDELRKAEYLTAEEAARWRKSLLNESSGSVVIAKLDELYDAAEHAEEARA
jgi:tRNA-dihydrouridine synthase